MILRVVEILVWSELLCDWTAQTEPQLLHII